jgi:predicted RNA binding protein with dsRBD fold (UPF0201 family)
MTGMADLAESWERDNRECSRLEHALRKRNLTDAEREKLKKELRAARERLREYPGATNN